MTLVKNKPRVTANQRKMVGSHHKKNKKYLKTYWPYLPIISILTGSILVSYYLPLSHENKNSLRSGYSARISSVIGRSNNILLDLMYIIFGCLVIWYALRHFKKLKKLAYEGEEYLAKHYLFDILIGVIIGGLFIMIT